MKEIWGANGGTEQQKGYEGRSDLGNTQPGDGKKFMGRGAVQITGRRNYTLYSKILGVDLVANPDLAMNPDIAAEIAVDGMKYGRFTGAKLSSYVNNKETDFDNARRVINGIDKASLITGHANSYLDVLNDCGWEEVK